MNVETSADLAVCNVNCRHVMCSIGLLWDASCQIASYTVVSHQTKHFCTTAYQANQIHNDLSNWTQMRLTPKNVIGLKLNSASASATASQALKGGP